MVEKSNKSILTQTKSKSIKLFKKKKILDVSCLRINNLIIETH